MGRRLVPLTLDNLQDLPQRCRSCVFWELDPVSGEAAVNTGTSDLEKEAWISAVLLDWGSCGRVVYVDDVPVGFVLYAPPAYVPRSTAFPTSPVSPDAVQLMTAFIVPGYQGQGLGRVMVQTVAKDLLRRGFKAIEAFGDARWKEPACVLPADHLLAVGFKTVRQHPTHPRLRLELRSTLSWK
jgi:GNAT superfamily N-acetyltransferase